ncbi:MAG: hypothetical protein KF819_26145 [Labilithrix sp.]|nr:hypothetical protein [Labilithrix sp.]
MTLGIVSEEASPRTSVVRFGPAWKKRTQGLNLLKVKGSFYEMGRQHGHLMSDEIRLGPIPYYRSFVEKIFGAERLGFAGPALVRVLQRTVGARIAAKLPPFSLETIRGLADGAGLSYASLLEGCTMPDSLLWAASRLMELKAPGPAVIHRMSLGLGCTSAIAWGGATKDGKLLHARNFDYHGVACWPRTQTVIFHEPDEGLRYASVAAAGVALGGVTAMNEAGLTLTVHQHMFTDQARLGGTPIGVLGDEVMRKAKNLDDAARILASHTPISCWTYLVTDGHRREVLCHEESPDRTAPRRIGKSGETTFGYANVYLDRELGDTEVNLYPSYWRHNRGRHARVNALLERGAQKGALDPASMGGILGDVGESGCRLHEAIAMVLTVGSVVFRPEDGAFWVGVGESPSSHGTFVPLSLAREDHAAELGSFRASVPEHARRAFEHFRRAYVAYTDARDLDGARREMGQACELEPAQSLYHATNGLLALAAGDAAAAAEKLGHAVRLGHTDEPRLAAFHLWRARALDLLGARDDAKRSYRSALALRNDAPVAAAAKKGLAKPFATAAARRMQIDMSLADVMSP